MAWRAVKCSACSRPAAACICASVARRHRRENRRTFTAKQYVVAPKSGVRWCTSCGCQVRDGRCVSATCGKPA